PEPLPNEFIGSHGGDVSIKRLNQAMVDSQLRKNTRTILGSREERWNRIPEHGRWMRMKCHGYRRKSELAPFLHEAASNRLMSQMHSVEISDGDPRALKLARKIIDGIPHRHYFFPVRDNSSSTMARFFRASA